MKFRYFVCLIFVGALCACQRGDPLDQKVSAETLNKLTLWKIHVRQSLAPEQLTDLDVAIQEVKVRVMLDRVASAGEAVDEAMRERIDGCTIREVLRTGFGSRLKRLEGERAELAAVVAANATMRTLPGRIDSALALRERQSLQAEDLQSLGERIKQVEAKLRLYDPDRAAKKPDAASAEDEGYVAAPAAPQSPAGDGMH